MNHKHRRSIRLKGYDYTQPGAYFVTICVKGGVHLFGAVRNGEMVLNAFGMLVRDEWIKTADLRPNVRMDEFVIMPDHMHGIIVIVDPDNVRDDVRRGTLQRAPTENKIPISITQRTEQFGKPVHNSIPTIVRGFKSTTTKQINQLRTTPGTRVWQRNYGVYPEQRRGERVVRDDSEWYRIRRYIENNPGAWSGDETRDPFDDSLGP